ncbi:hypothetical protein RMSM_05309 [Rhodopirellula maiorica SM1]|uniref:Uncharacterized protein n=1 Tax=Rhodopirellula maiorica SM1 TaxID=1265738 RepID=M5REB1_9BACT|nr:hypothetical protein [Rhodopirellula maiorica]EMI17783.1 hypothetical protein RMSM_05309 [Rhodopirellula maiorica SM1]
MSYFANLFRGHIAAAHQSFFATSVQITEPGSSAESTSAVVHNTRIVTRSTATGTVTVATRRCRFTQLESVRDDSVVTIDSIPWMIEEMLATETPGTEVTLVRTLKNEVARDHYRR